MSGNVAATSPSRTTKSSRRTGTEVSWEREPQERGDFLHRVRAFPASVREWREKLATVDNAGIPAFKPNEIDVAQRRALIDDGLTRLREVTRILELLSSSRRRARTQAIDAGARRVLRRLEPWRELGLEGDLADRGTARDLTPPLLGEALFHPLSEHGSAICLPREPKCEGCEIRKLCGSYRRASVESARSVDKPVAIDLFSGAGGLSEGLRLAGFHIAAAADSDAGAIKTYRLNHPEMPDSAAMVRDVRELKSIELKKLMRGRRLDLLAGAPPCQGFSSAGLRSKSSKLGYRAIADERNMLFEWLVQLALDLKPRLFLMENVPGMESAKKDDLSYIQTAARMLERGGYRTATWKLSAAAFGVPQERMRCFLVASANQHLPLQPSEEYQNTRRGEFDADALPCITLDEAIFDLPPLEAGTGSGIEAWHHDASESAYRHRRYLGKFKLTAESRLIYNHYARYNNDRDLELYDLLQQGEDSVHAIEKHNRPDLMRYRRDVFDDKYARLRADRPCKTIVSHLAKDGNGYIHPTQVRSLSIRESARVQSFPDDFIFTGSPSDQWIQLGNAVPPLLAAAIARTFIQALKVGDK